MALLDETAKTQVLRAIIRYWGHLNLPTGVKTSIVTAVEKCDEWMDGNEASSIGVNDGLNSYLNSDFKSWSTVSQRSDLFIFVVARRRSVEILRRLFGRIN